MSQVNRSALLPYSAEQMYDIVNDVAASPAFLPWCDDSRVISVDEGSMIVELTVARSGAKQSFTTRNDLFRPERIELQLVDGPFRRLAGSWQFHSLGEDGCRVEMQLSFDIDLKLASAVLSKVFEQATNTLVDAFCDRADHIYGGADD